MEYVFMGIIVIIVGVWMIRHLYNFFQKNKYILLDQNKNTLKNRLQAGLPAIIFYFLVFLIIWIPSIVNQVVSSQATFMLFVLQIVLIFLITRYDKFQTKYSITDLGITYRNKFISWGMKYSITYKKTWLFVLHKPRFIISTSSTKIAIPVLSENLNLFISELVKRDSKNGVICEEIIDNIKAYYIKNPELKKQLNRI